jgi:hypothetical protein
MSSVGASAKDTGHWTLDTVKMILRYLASHEERDTLSLSVNVNRHHGPDTHTENADNEGGKTVEVDHTLNGAERVLTMFDARGWCPWTDGNFKFQTILW